MSNANRTTPAPIRATTELADKVRDGWWAIRHPRRLQVGRFVLLTAKEESAREKYLVDTVWRLAIVGERERADFREWTREVEVP